MEGFKDSRIQGFKEKERGDPQDWNTQENAGRARGMGCRIKRGRIKRRNIGKKEEINIRERMRGYNVVGYHEIICLF
jgi:hypothetical protein